MDYKKKYEEAMFRMNKWVEGSEIIDPKEVAEYIFPELKESEDEEIRKELISLFQDGIDGVSHRYYGSDCSRWIAWLEKQGEQKVVKFMTKSYITPNPEFFQWIYDRLIYQHHENPNMDYMRSLKERIEDMQEIVDVKTGDGLVRQNSTWSEEDEYNLNWIIKDYERASQTAISSVWECRFKTIVSWLKSLKERMKGE